MSISSGNVILVLGVTNVYPVPQQIQGFAEDVAFDTEGVTVGENKIGVDGGSTSGRRFNFTPMTITLMGDSPSNLFFSTWNGAEETNIARFPGFGVATYPDLGTEWVLTRGWLTMVTKLPKVGTTIQSRTYRIEWTTAIPVPVPQLG